MSREPEQPEVTVFKQKLQHAVIAVLFLLVIVLMFKFSWEAISALFN